MAYNIFIRSLLTDQPITIFGDGEQTRGNTYIDDCVDGTVRAMQHGQAGEVYNLGGGTPISLNAAIALIENATGRKARREYTAARRGDQRHTLADVSKARAHFGYEPKTAPAEGLPRQVEWQRALLAGEDSLAPR
jgi:nucleoside-diphosphate-sugar epimerase